MGGPPRAGCAAGSHSTRSERGRPRRGVDGDSIAWSATSRRCGRRGYQLLERHPHLEAGERRAEAEVRAEAEGEVAGGVLPADVEGLRLCEGVARRTFPEASATSTLAPAGMRTPPISASLGADAALGRERGTEAQALLDRGRDEPRVGADRLPTGAAVVQQEEHCVGQRAARRLVSGGERRGGQTDSHSSLNSSGSSRAARTAWGSRPGPLGSSWSRRIRSRA